MFEKCTYLFKEKSKCLPPKFCEKKNEEDKEYTQGRSQEAIFFIVRGGQPYKFNQNLNFQWKFGDHRGGQAPAPPPPPVSAPEAREGGLTTR